MHQFFAYIRVSDPKQKDGASLPEQKDAILRYAQQFGLEIGRWFAETRTAAKTGRPAFTEMMRLLKQKRAQGIILHKLDRGARNLRDWADLDQMIDEGIEVRFTNDSYDLRTRGGRLSADIQAAVSADFIRNLREETKKGLDGRLKQGLYPFGAPPGFLDQGEGKVKTIDPQNGPLVIQAFELHATASYTLASLIDEMHRRGLRNKRGGRLSLNSISAILRNPFYIGLMRVKNQVFQGNHQPLITKALFDRVQRILLDKTVVRKTQHNFTFRQLVKCDACDYSLIGELQKGHVYYRCHTRGCTTKAIREEIVDEKLCNAFRLLHLDDEEITCAGVWVRNARLEQYTIREQEIQNVKLMQDQAQARRTRLTDAFLDGTIEKELFEERKAGLLLEATGLKEKLGHLEQGDGGALIRMEKFLELTRTASLLHQQAFPHEKRELVKKLTSNLSATRKNISVALTIPAQLIASRKTITSGVPERGAHRTEPEPRTLEGTLRKLLEHFTKEPTLIS